MRRRRILVALAMLTAPTQLASQADSVPRDSTRRDSTFTSPSGIGRVTVHGRAFQTFVNHAPEQLLGLVPGVVVRGTETGLASASQISIRGGRPGQAAVYVDGAPVRFQIQGGTGLILGFDGAASAAVTTGAPDLSLPDMRDGVIEYTTRKGDDSGSSWINAAGDLGRSPASLGRFGFGLGAKGRVWGTRASFYFGGDFIGQNTHYTGLGAAAQPAYVSGGIDAIVPRVVDGNTESLVLPLFIDHRSYDWVDQRRGLVKLEFEYGVGSSVGFSAVSDWTQQRFFPGMSALTASLFRGAESDMDVYVANWRQSLGLLGDRTLTMRVNVSHGSSETTSGLLEADNEALTIVPPIHPVVSLRFIGEESMPFPLNDQIIRNVRTNSGLRVPYLNRDDLRNVQASRANPYGMSDSWPTAGTDGTLDMAREKRWDGRLAFDWQVAPSHTITVGGDAGRASVSSYSAQLLRMAFFDGYLATPSRAGLYAADRLVAGPLRVELAARYDHFGSVGLLPDVPGRIYTHPEFNPVEAVTSDTAYANSVERVMSPARSHDAFAFRAAVEHALSSRTTLRMSLGRWAEPPALGLVLENSNSDLDFTSSFALFGRDVDYGYATLADAGASHRFGDGFGLDLAVYRRSRPEYLSTIAGYPDPQNPGDIININSLTNAGNVVDLGLDVAADWQPQSWLEARVAYGFRVTDQGQTRSGPFGETVPTFTTHAVTAAALVRPGGPLLSGFEVSALLRLTSGTWYTAAFVSPGSGSGAVTPSYDVVYTNDNYQLPWTKRLDLRVQRVTPVKGGALSVFLEAQNLFGWQNILSVFTETRSTVNPAHRQQRLAAEFASLESEANDNGALAGNGDILLPADCSTWTNALGSQGAVLNCVALKRVEGRFGNGDAVYTLAERTNALNTFYDAFYGPQTFYGSGRSVRLGVELRW